MSPTPQPSLDSMTPFWKGLVFKTIICPSLREGKLASLGRCLCSREVPGSLTPVLQLFQMMGVAWAGSREHWALLLAQ